MSIVSYKNLVQVPSTAPTGPGGLAIYTSSRQLADRFGQIVAGGFNVLDYGASGSIVTTTGTVSGGSPSLVVASATSFVVGQGILIKGAGAAGVHHITSIDAIAGTTITLHVAAVTGVGGAVVQHDDTAAVNLALAAAYNAGGGDVFVPSGYYRTNGAYTAATNSILTLPQTGLGDASGSMVRVGLIGQARAKLGVSGGLRSYAGGTCFDCTDAPTPSGTVPAWFAPAPYAAQTTGTGYNSALWHNSFCYFRDFALIFDNQTIICGLMLSNAFQAIVDDGVLLACQVSGGAAPSPASPGVGLYLPQAFNAVTVGVRQAQISGFYYAIVGGEHCHFEGPYVDYANTGLYTGGAFQLMGTGYLRMQHCVTMITVSAMAAYDMHVFGEPTVGGGDWWARTTLWGVVDGGNNLRGTIRYFIFGASRGETMDVNGGANAHFTNIYA